MSPPRFCPFLLYLKSHASSLLPHACRYAIVSTLTMTGGTSRVFPPVR